MLGNHPLARVVPSEANYATAVALSFHLLLPAGIPLSYFYLLYQSRHKIRARDIETEIVYMLCEDYTADCWYVIDSIYIPLAGRMLY